MAAAGPRGRGAACPPGTAPKDFGVLGARTGGQEGKPREGRGPALGAAFRALSPSPGHRPHRGGRAVTEEISRSPNLPGAPLAREELPFKDGCPEHAVCFVIRVACGCNKEKSRDPHALPHFPLEIPYKSVGIGHNRVSMWIQPTDAVPVSLVRACVCAPAHACPSPRFCPV